MLDQLLSLGSLGNGYISLLQKNFTLKLLNYLSCFFFSHDVINIMTGSNLERKGRISSYPCKWLSVIRGSQGRNSSRDHGETLFIDFLPGLKSVYISHTSQAFLPRDKTSQSGLDFPTSINDQKVPHKYEHSLI